MTPEPMERQTLAVDIACVGFGPAVGGFLTTLARGLLNDASNTESSVLPGVPPQIVCYERAGDIGFGVSGAVTRARGLRASFPDFDPAQIPLAAAVTDEKLLYLLDPHGASRRPAWMRLADRLLRHLAKHHAVELPYLPAFLHKKGGLVLSLGQFNQWVGTHVMAYGAGQIWPGTPVAQALIENGCVAGVRLLDQGVDVRAALTVVGDGPVGAVGRQLDAHFGMPAGHAKRDWAVGMKFVIDLPESCTLGAGTVLHTIGYPEPEIFGFLYVHPQRVASVGIFVPSWFDSPVRTGYRYLQHYILHPYLWRHLEGGTLRSWGAKSLDESGRRGEPYLAGHGYARIGEGSGSTNVLTGSGVDEAWTTGVQLAEAVMELWKQGKPFTKENLEASYVARRRASWVEREGRIAQRARDGFHRGVLAGLFGMALAGLTGGRLFMPGRAREKLPTAEEYFAGRIPAPEIARLRAECAGRGVPLHDALMERCGWSPIPYDGRLLVSHQDALLVGGKVQAPPGYADHVAFLYPELCEKCGARVCIEICSGEAIHPGEEGIPAFDREKCIHCGACIWNCDNIDFRPAPGGLHSAEN